MNYEFEGFATQGWQCPICKRVYSPTTPMCYYCGNGVPYTVSSTTDDAVIDWLHHESATKAEKPKEDFTEKWKKAIQGTSDYETYVNHNVVDSIHAEINSGIIEDMEPRKNFCD